METQKGNYMKNKYANIVKNNRARARAIPCFDWQVDAPTRIPIRRVSMARAATFCVGDIGSYASLFDPDFAIELSLP
jgi:hypothetical protein